MTQKTTLNYVEVGREPNDFTGDMLRTAFKKVNYNFKVLVEVGEVVAQKTSSFKYIDNIHYPTTKAVYDLVQKREDLKNKVRRFTPSTNLDDTKYPTTKAVHEYVKGFISFKEDKLNKAKTFNLVNHELYPTTKAVDTLVKSKENLVNKAKTFKVVDDYRYPTTKAVVDYLSKVALVDKLDRPKDTRENALVKFDSDAGTLANTPVTVEDDGSMWGFKGKVRYVTIDNNVITIEDSGLIIDHNSTTNSTCVLPNTLPVGFVCSYIQTGLGKVTFTPQTGGTLANRLAHTKTAGLNAAISLYVRSNIGGKAAEWILFGDTRKN